MRKIVIVLILAIMLAPIISSGASADGSWSVFCSPIFAFSGDSVNVTVTNSGSDRFGFVDLVAPNGTVISEDFFTLGALGSYSYNLTLPYWIQSGDYSLSVVAGGVRVVNTTLNVTLDQLVYREILDQMTNAKIAVLDQRVMNQNALILQEIKLREDSMLLLEICVVITVICAVVMALMFRPYVEWKLSNYRGNNAFVKGWKLITHLPPEGDHAYHIEGVGASRKKILKERRMKERQEEAAVAIAPIQEVEEQIEPIPELITEPEVLVPESVVDEPVIQAQVADELDEFSLDSILKQEETIPIIEEKKIEKVSELPWKVLTVKEKNDDEIATLKTGIRPAMEDNPTIEESEPIIVPWNASKELADELRQRGIVERRKLVDEPIPPEVVQNANKTTKKRGRKPMFNKPEAGVIE